MDDSGQLSTGEILFLSRDDVFNALDPKTALSAAEDAFRWVDEGRIDQRNPINFELDDPDLGMGGIQAFPAVSHPQQAGGCKWLSFYLDNARRGLPSFAALMVLTDTVTGQPIAIMDGQAITVMRTAGHAAVGAKYLASPGATTLAIIGCGNQGREHLRAFDELFDLETVLVNDHSQEHAEVFAAEWSKRLTIPVESKSTPKEAVVGADIVCMTTTAEEPIVMADWIESGTHVAATAGFLDLDASISADADVWCVGWRNRDLTWIDGEETGMFGPDTLDSVNVDADLMDIIGGDHPGRTRTEDRTLFTHMGMPALDVTAAAVAVEAALEAELGQRLEMYS